VREPAGVLAPPADRSSTPLSRLLHALRTAVSSNCTAALRRKGATTEAQSMHTRPSFVVALMLSFWCVGAWTQHGAWARETPCVGDCNHDGRLTIDELVTGVTMALGTASVDRCPDFDAGGNHTVTVDELVLAVHNALVGCGAHVNRPPRASDVSFSTNGATPYVQKQLIGSDPDDDTITYELVSNSTGTGYSFAYINPESGMLFLTLAADFRGTLVLWYRVTDGTSFSNTANATLEVQAATEARNSGLQDVTPEEYASFPRGYFNGAVQGAPGLDPALPSSVDLSGDFPLPGNQGHLDSCVAWALGYALRSYAERLEHGWSLEPDEHRFSPSYMYNLLNGGRDNGIIYNQGLDFLVTNGVATLARMPYDDTDFLTQPDAAANAEAA